ncbi:MAG: PSD1 and planctomycete cytochrome C domain-containing protein [Planctomycetota bacterium]
MLSIKTFKRPRSRHLHPIASLAILLLVTDFARGQEVQFNRDIRPLLSDRCFHCHGPDEHDRQAGLRLDQADGSEGAHEFAIVPGSPSESELYDRLLSEDPDRVMPPPDSHKKPLTAAEKELFRQWIQQGAAYESFWAFLPPAMPDLPAQTASSPIDQFVLRRLQLDGMSASPPADKRTLIRRLSLDLTGLPPTRREIQDFLSDDAPDAYEKLVDRLLSSPHYGEHMARYWLDLVRFADTNGIHHDHYRELSPYRDWVIRAFNENLPYSDFVRYQLAGDLYPEPTRDQLIASGFHRLHLIIDVGTALPEESFTRNVLDRVTSVGTAFMGLTVQCAVCHDHKYDPLTMKEFYSLSAFFNNLDAPPETGRRSGTDFWRGLQAPYIDLPSTDQTIQLADLHAEVAAKQARLASLQKEVQSPKIGQAEKDGIQSLVEAAKKQLKLAQTKRDDHLKTIPAAMIMKERDEIRPAHVLIRGAYDNPGEQVPRATPAFLPPMKQAGETATRMDLADWFTSPQHPLTARVAVNRFWQQVFGVGIVKTSEDFGAQGEWPSHPDLLDYLTVRFVESGWDVRALMKEIVLSNTYRQSSFAAPKVFERDPDNRLLARGSRYRMDSEMIRDQVLASSGRLHRQLFGKSVKPPQMTILNAPSREECIARRERTNTPLQALLLLNETEYLKASRHLAARVLAEHTGDAQERLHVIYETVTALLPNDQECESLLALLNDLETAYKKSLELTEELCGEMTLPDGVSSEQLAAWTVLTSALYNLDITKTRQ